MRHADNKYTRRLAGRRRLWRLWLATRNAYGCGAYVCRRRRRLVRYSCNSAALRRSMNRVHRHRTRRVGLDEARQAPSAYRRAVDYWYTLL